MADIRWFIFGKHPAFADYLNFGCASHLSSTFSNWVRQGFERHVSEGGSSRQPCAYRFWAKADDKHGLVIGILKSSADSMGRPFPLLLLGTVSLKGWKDQWQMLAEYLEIPWSGMEIIANTTYEKPPMLIQDLSEINLPGLKDRLGAKSCETTPNLLFIGGCHEKQSIIRYTEPLTAQDFIRLWTDNL